MWRIAPNGEVARLAPDKRASGVWVPSEAISFFHEELPARSRRVARQVAPFALEDHLVAPVETQHFALGALADGGAPIAVVSDDLIARWMASLAEAGCEPKALWPDVFAVPFEEGRPTLWHEGGRFLFRDGEASGIAGEADWVIPLAQRFADEERLRVFSDATAELPEAWAARAEPLPAPLEERMLAADAEPPLDLLQGDYAPESSFGFLRSWGKVAAVAALAFATYTAGLVVETSNLQARAGTVREAVRAQLEGNFPAGVEANLRPLVQRHMEALKQGGEGRRVGPWNIMVALEPVLGGCRPCRIEALEYTDNGVTLEVSASGEPGLVKQRLARVAGAQVAFEELPALGEREVTRVMLAPETAQ